jgi:hypothetical protein
MKTSRVSRHHYHRALTRLEIVVIVAVIALLTLVAVPPLMMAPAKKTHINCWNNLKNIGLASRIWSTDNMAGFPWQADTNRGGTLRFVSDPLSLWRHFLAVSNELAPRLVICPTDNERQPARTWAEFNDNRFVSYSLGFTATEELPNSVLATDRNVLLDGSPLANAIVSFPSNANVTFDDRLHQQAGNVLLGDGSVQQLRSDRLREAFRAAQSALGTNQTLAFP